MRIKKEHYEYMKKLVGALDLDKMKADYERGDFVNADRVKDLQQRFCFDVLRAAGLMPFVCGTLYTYANDNHIFTVLKKICPKIERKY